MVSLWQPWNTQDTELRILDFAKFKTGVFALSYGRALWKPLVNEL